MLCKVVKRDDTYIIEHITDKYFNIGECTICEEFAYGWYPIVHSKIDPVLNTIKSGGVVQVNNIECVKLDRLIRTTDVDLGEDYTIYNRLLYHMYNIKLDALDSIRVVDIYKDVAMIIRTLSNDALTSAEQTARIESEQNVYERAEILAEIERDLLKIKDMVDIDGYCTKYNIQ